MGRGEENLVEKTKLGREGWCFGEEECRLGKQNWELAGAEEEGWGWVVRGEGDLRGKKERESGGSILFEWHGRGDGRGVVANCWNGKTEAAERGWRRRCASNQKSQLTFLPVVRERDPV
ncbi:hypothetical protein BaRGS_00015816 [Batillaria attramentaria]|uniref:Uncharacterized protein n=1 Tax=Batillaria attramentaria TaxID=370345 RepID=A0ABD0L055_9CAEN